MGAMNRAARRLASAALWGAVAAVLALCALVFVPRTALAASGLGAAKPLVLIVAAAGIGALAGLIFSRPPRGRALPPPSAPSGERRGGRMLSPRDDLDFGGIAEGPDELDDDRPEPVLVTAPPVEAVPAARAAAPIAADAPLGELLARLRRAAEGQRPPPGAATAAAQDALHRALARLEAAQER